MRVYVIMQLVAVWAAILDGMLCGKYLFPSFFLGGGGEIYYNNTNINFSRIEKHFHILAHAICICYHVSLMFCSYCIAH